MSLGTIHFTKKTYNIEQGILKAFQEVYNSALNFHLQ